MTDNKALIKQAEVLIDKLIAVVCDEPLEVATLSLASVLTQAARLDYDNNDIAPAATWMTVSDMLNDLSLELTGEAVDVTAKLISALEGETDGATLH